MIIPDLIDFLSEELPGTFVGMEAPEDTTGYVLIDQTASSRRNHIITTTVAIQSYGSSLVDAFLLNETVKGKMEDFLDEEGITRVSLETDYNFTNTATKQYRWQAVYQITHY